MVRESAMDCSAVRGIDYTDMYLLYHVGKYRDRCGNPWKDRDTLLMFYLYTYFMFTVSLVFGEARK